MDDEYRYVVYLYIIYGTASSQNDIQACHNHLSLQRSSSMNIHDNLLHLVESFWR